MPAKQTITHEATVKEGMVLGELAAFVQDALRRNVDPATFIEARVTMRGKVRSLTVTDANSSWIVARTTVGTQAHHLAMDVDP